MSDDENGNASERGTPKATSAVKEHARKMLAKLRAKLSGTHARYLTCRSWMPSGRPSTLLLAHSSIWT
jgi:hypothetical protein